MKMVKETLDEDSWNDTDIDDSEIDPNDVDTSDMENNGIEIEEENFNDQLLVALSNEVKIPEFSRRTLKFRAKCELGKTIHGVPMAKMKDDAFLFKIGDKMKKYYVSDIIIEGDNKKHSRAKQVNESIDFTGWRDKL